MTDSTPIQITELLRHHRWVEALAGALVLDPAGADDVVQETWRRILERPPRAVRHPRAWLAAVVRQSAANRARGEARRRRREEAAAKPETGHPTDGVARATLQRDLVDAILGLPEAQRDTLLARFYDELPPREIARLHGVAVTTVKSRLRRGLEELRARLDRDYGDRSTWSLAFLPLTRTHATGTGLAGGLLLPAVLVTLLVGGAWLVLEARSTGRPSEAPESAGVTEAGIGARATVAVGPSSTASGSAASQPMREASVAPVRRAADGPPVLVLAADGAPVSGARVRYANVVQDGERGEVITGEDGRVLLPASGDWFLAVEPEVGIGLAELSSVGAEGATLHLPPHGSLELRFVDAAGYGVAGVEARLASPDASPGVGFGVHAVPNGSRLLRDAWSEFLTTALSGELPWPPDTLPNLWESAREVRGRNATALTRALFHAWPALEPRRTSGPDGRVRWDGLPPATTWEVQVTSDHEIAEPDEVRGVEVFPDGSSRTNFAAIPPPNTSQAFEVRTGEVTAAELELILQASVHGVLEPGESGWEVAPTVVLVDVASPAAGARHMSVEQSVEAIFTGAFSLDAVRPGEKILRSRWADAHGRLRVVYVSFEVQPGEALDLGSLTPREGRELELRIRLRGPLGEELDPALVEHGRTPIASSLRLTVHAADGSRQRVDGYRDLRPWLGDTLHLTGIPEGEELSVEFSLVSFVPPEGYRIAERTLRERLPFPEDGAVELSFVLEN